MDTDSKLYQDLNKAWKSTCKVLLGDEVGELNEYKDWLTEFVEKPRIEHSVVSGKVVHLASDDYCKGAKFISFDEVDFSKKFDPLNINEIKDIDSVVNAVQERVQYTGNVILGNSKYIEGSSNITDSTYVSDSYIIDISDHIAYGRKLRGDKFVFGANGLAFCEFVIKGNLGTKNIRGMELYSVRLSSDVYYSANLSGCSDCIFCFNLRGRRHSIGNLSLPQETYKETKKKLLSEISEELKNKKRIPSLLSIVSKFPREKLEIRVPDSQKFNIEPIDSAFKQTVKILLRKDAESIEKYSEALLKHVPRRRVLKETASRGSVIVTEGFGKLPAPEKRIISYEEAEILSEQPKQLELTEVQTLSLTNTASLSKIAFLTFDATEGKNANVKDISAYTINAMDCYAATGCIEAKACAYTFWPRHSSFIFGSDTTLESSFCIHSYNSKRLNRTFQVDSCENCSDLYYSHNCENVQDSMFCFNVKNLKNAIGNAQLPLEQYRKIKDSILQQIGDEFITKKSLKWDIYNIGCTGKG
jgi:hypothetical protein